MKKHLKICFLCATISLVLAMTLVGCSKKTPPVSTEKPDTTPVVESFKEESSEVESSEVATEPPHVHNYGEWIELSAATCTQKGSHKRACDCGNEQTEDIAALGHDEKSHAEKEPTCTEKGWKAYVTCSRCDHTTYEELAPSHTMVDDMCTACYYPYTPIRTVEELKNISISEKYVLVNDIDLGGAEWTPIGTKENAAFYGVFNGYGHKVSNFKITLNGVLISNSMGNQAYIGFFNSNSGTIKNFGLENFTIDINTETSSAYLGGLTGYNYWNGKITNCYSKGTVKVYSNRNVEVGGLIGCNYKGTVSNCYANTDVRAEAVEAIRIGGLIGNQNTAELSNCYATGNIFSYSANMDDYTGGLVGCGNIFTNCYATGDISGTGYAGGLAGSGSSFTNCYATGNVLSRGCAGGLVGYGAKATDCYATGDVVVTAYANEVYAGGLIGTTSTAFCRISNCHATGTVLCSSMIATQLTQNSYAGGLIGYTEDGNVSNCYATGKVTCSHSFVTSANIVAGGLIGHGKCTVTDSYAIGTVGAYSANDSTAGGLIGNNSGKVSSCYSTGDVEIEADGNASHAGGFFGDNDANEVKNCYSTGNVTVRGNTTRVFVGGFGGYNLCSLSNCYSTGNVNVNITPPSLAEVHVGSLFGCNTLSTIKNCYAVGNVTVNTINSDVFSGDIIGGGHYKVTDCYHGAEIVVSITIDGNTTTAFANAYGTAKPTAELCSAKFLTQALGWSTEVWEFKDGQHPTLK